MVVVVAGSPSQSSHASAGALAQRFSSGQEVRVNTLDCFGFVLFIAICGLVFWKDRWGEWD